MLLRNEMGRHQIWHADVAHQPPRIYIFDAFESATPHIRLAAEIVVTTTIGHVELRFIPFGNSFREGHTHTHTPKEANAIGKSHSTFMHQIVAINIPVHENEVTAGETRIICAVSIRLSGCVCVCWRIGLPTVGTEQQPRTQYANHKSFCNRFLSCNRWEYLIIVVLFFFLFAFARFVYRFPLLISNSNEQTDGEESQPTSINSTSSGTASDVIVNNKSVHKNGRDNTWNMRERHTHTSHLAPHISLSLNCWIDMWQTIKTARYSHSMSAYVYSTSRPTFDGGTSAKEEEEWELKRCACVKERESRGRGGGQGTS